MSTGNVCCPPHATDSLLRPSSPHSFEQFGEQTLLLIFCGPKGNGKTLRTERAMRVFVEGWVHMSGPSSAKSGMQGNSDSHNGCNCIYDEMIDDLTASDGDNRTECTLRFEPYPLPATYTATQPSNFQAPRWMASGNSFWCSLRRIEL